MYLIARFLFISFLITFPLHSEDGYGNNDGVDIYYVDYGPANHEPILLVQGLGGQLTFWPDELIELLQNNGFRPIVYDNRDVGCQTALKSMGGLTLSGIT